MPTLTARLLRPALAALVALLPSLGAAQHYGAWTYLEDLNAKQIAMSYVRNGEEVAHFWCFGGMNEIQFKTYIVGGRHHKPGDVMRLQLVTEARAFQFDTFHSERDGQLFNVLAMIPTNSPFFPNLLKDGQFYRAVIGQHIGPAQRIEIDKSIEDFRKFWSMCAWMQSS